MQPENNMQNNIPNNAPAMPQAEVAAVETVEVKENVPMGEAPKKDNMFENTPKKSNGMLIGLILCLILAIGGIGFGVWAMMDGNQQKEQLNSQISSLKQQNNTLEDKITELQAEVDSYKNASADVYEILPPEWGEAEAVIVDNKFTIKNGKGEIYMQWDEQEVNEIVSCDSGTSENQLPMTCVVKTPNGEAKIIYDFDEHSLEFIEENN